MKKCIILIAICYGILLVSSLKVQTSSKSNLKHISQGLLEDYMKTNARIEGLSTSTFTAGDNHKIIEKQSNDLNVRYADLLEIFNQPSFIEKSPLPVAMKVGNGPTIDLTHQIKVPRI